MVLRAINTIGDSVDKKLPKREGILRAVHDDARTELPSDARGLKVSEVLRGHEFNGLPFTLVTAGDGIRIGDDAKIFEGFYVNAPHDNAGAFFEAPPERRLSLGSRLAFAACLGLTAAGAVAGCNNNSHADGSSSDQALSQMHFALQQASDADHFGPLQQAAFSLDGDNSPAIGDYNGETVISFTRQDASGIQRCWYVKAPDVEQALTTPNATIIVLQGSEGQPADSGINSCIFDENKIIYQRAMEATGIADIVQNGENLTAQNTQPLHDIVPGEFSLNTPTMKLIEEGGVKYLIYDVGGGFTKLNLTTGEKTISNGNTACETPFRDPQSGLWIGSKFGNYGGPVHCRVVKADTLQGLQASMQYIPGLLTQPGVGVTGEGKNAEIQGEVMILEAKMKDPATGQLLPSRIYYAVVVEYCGNGQCGEGEDNASCASDCPIIPPVDAGGQDAPDAGTPDPDAGTLDPDAGIPDPDAGTPDPDAGTPDQDAGTPDQDAGQDAGPDAGPDAAQDTGPDIQIPPQEICADGIDNDGDGLADCRDPDCFPKIGQISWLEGQDKCAVPSCETTADYETADIEGTCTFSVDLGGANPVILTIDGKYSVDLLNKMGELLLGKYKVVDNGNNFETIFSNSVTGVSGTTYEGMETVIEGSDHKAYHLKCIDGKITLSVDGVVIATLEAGEEGTYDLEDPHPQVEDVGTDEDAEVVDGGQDAGDGGNPDASDGGNPDTPGDATVSHPDAIGADSNPETPTEKGGNGGGCSMAEKGANSQELAMFGMLLAMAAMAMRRQNKTQRLQRRIDGGATPEKPQLPGEAIVESLKKGFRNLLERFKA